MEPILRGRRAAGGSRLSGRARVVLRDRVLPDLMVTHRTRRGRVDRACADGIPTGRAGRPGGGHRARSPVGCRPRVQREPLLRADFGQGLPDAAPDHRREAEVPVRHADVLGEPDPVTGVFQGPRVPDSVVAQRVVLGDLDQCRWEARQVVGQDRRGHRRVRVPVRTEVLVAESEHHRRREDGVIGAGGGVAVEILGGAQVGRRVDERLVRDPRTTPVAQQLADHRGQIAAGAVAHHGDPGGVRAELGGVPVHPVHGGHAVQHRGREPVQRRQSVVH
jgi:hypothetical protein